MPTGYTYKVAEGKETFPEFVWRCARAFDALVDLKEDLNAPIPEKLETDTHSRDRLNDARRKLCELRRSPQREVRLAYAVYVSEYWRCTERSAEEDARKRRNYEAMLEQVRHWKPPTKKHRWLRDFMREQLQESVCFDCPKSTDMTPMLSYAAWKEWRNSMAVSDVKYWASRWREDQRRTAERNKWLAALRKSVPLPERKSDGVS